MRDRTAVCAGRCWCSYRGWRQHPRLRSSVGTCTNQPCTRADPGQTARTLIGPPARAPPQARPLRNKPDGEMDAARRTPSRARRGSASRSAPLPPFSLPAEHSRSPQAPRPTKQVMLAFARPCCATPSVLPFLFPPQKEESRRFRFDGWPRRCQIEGAGSATASDSASTVSSHASLRRRTAWPQPA